MRTITPVLSGVLAVLLITGCPQFNIPFKNTKELKMFRFLATENIALDQDVAGTITGNSITLMVPHGTKVTALVARFTLRGIRVSIGHTPQTSGTTPNDFTKPVTYTIRARDGTTRDYTITVTIQKNNAKELTTFRFLGKSNSAVTTDVTGTITGQTIALTVPSGTNVTALIATFTAIGESVSIGNIIQTSGTTPNNFTHPVTYTVTAENGDTQNYTVTVVFDDTKELTTFRFLGKSNSAVTTDVTGTITGQAIALTVPHGTNVTALIATFTAIGKSVSIGSIAQTSGTTPNNFTHPVTYTVTASNGTKRDYTITVTIQKNNAKALTAFRFLAGINSVLSMNITGTITGQAIALTVPHGTDVTALIATFTAIGENVSIGSITQTSGTTPNNFTHPVTYTVTAQNGSTQDYTVMVAITDAKEDTRFLKSSKQPGDSAVITLTTSSRTQKMIYANNKASRTFPTGVDDTGTATLTHQFWMGETEVTNELFAAVYQWAYENKKFSTTTGSRNSLNKDNANHGGKKLVALLDSSACRVKYDSSGVFSVESQYKNHPVTNVSWYGAIMFCNWLTEMRDGNTDNVVYSGINSDWKHTETIEDKRKNGYRLPSSNEWEYAARYRGTDTNNVVKKRIQGTDFTKMKLKWTKGDSASGATANTRNNLVTEKVAMYGTPGGGNVAVKTKAPNTLGLYDMSGNVYEWCFPRTSMNRVIRGGSWDHGASDLKVGFVDNTAPDDTRYLRGFRLCRTAD